MANVNHARGAWRMARCAVFASYAVCYAASCATTTSHETFVTSPNADGANLRDDNARDDNAHDNNGDITTAPPASRPAAPAADPLDGALDGAVDQDEPSFTFEVSTVTRGGTTQFCYDHTVGDIATGRKCFASKAVYCENLCLEVNTVSQRVCRAECPAPTAPVAAPTAPAPPEGEAPAVKAPAPR